MSKKKHDSGKEQNGSSRATGTPHQIELEIEHHVQATSLFSNHLIVQADPETVYLSFFQINPPFVFSASGTDEDKLAALKKAGKLIAECVAKVAIPRGKIGSFIEAINKTASKVDAGNIVEIKAK
jgi:hypothetical protein